MVMARPVARRRARRVGGVVGGAGGGENARTGFLAHLGIAVQGAAHGGLRKAERLGQFPEIHGLIGPKALLTRPEAMPADRDLSKIQNRPIFLHLRDNPLFSSGLRLLD
jgi:hypothetical protein